MINKTLFQPNQAILALSLRSLFLLLACFLVLTFFGGAPAQADIRLGLPGYHSLYGQLQFLPDPSAAMSLEDVLTVDSAKRFRPIRGFLNRGYTRDASWLKITVSREADATENFYLWLNPPMLDEVTVYFQTGENPLLLASYASWNLGDHTPEAEKPIQHQGLLAPISIDDTSKHQIYIRIRSKSTHALSGSLMTGDRLATQTSKNLVFHASFLAITLLLSALNLFLGFRLKEKTYALYGLYLFSVIGLYLGNRGILTIVWPESVHWLSDILVGIGNGMGYAFFALFFMSLFKTKNNFPRAHRYMQLLLVLGVLATLTIPTFWYGQASQIVSLFGLVGLYLMFWVGVKAIKAGFPGGRVFLLAFTPNTLGGTIILLLVVGQLPVNWFTLHAFQLGTLIHMIVMTIALSERVREEKNKAFQAVQLSEQQAVILAKKMTRELEEKALTLEKSLSTEQKLRAEQAHFVDMISHEYRTPLAILQANLEIVRTRFKKGKPLENANFSKMNRAVLRLTEIFTRLMQQNFTEIEAISIDKKTLHIKPYVTENVKAAEELWGTKRLRFKINLAEDLLLLADPALLNIAFWNLFDNAIKYSLPGAPIEIETTCSGKQWQIDILNRIAGDHTLVAEQLFTKAVRGKNTAGIAGTGFGLYLTRQIIEQHDGKVTLEQPQPDLVCARVLLPLQKQKGAAYGN